MKQPRIISAGGCLAALLVAGCGGGGVSPGSIANLPGVAAPSGPAARQSPFVPSPAVPGSGLPQSLGSQRALGRFASHGKERVLYSFAGVGGDGISPVAGLINVGGTLYGETGGGGAGGASAGGTVFKITTSGMESILHSFKQNTRDGIFPYGGLTNVAGTLYGTTTGGGGASYAGTVFKLTTSGAESVLHRFAGGSDGASPYAGLTKVGSALYGTTFEGGGVGPGDLGTVFKVTTSGAESVLYRFANTPDGAFPWAGLTKVGGTLYGTTLAGGAHGDGTVFKITTSGAESVLYSFAGGSDGALPYGGLTNVGGTLYGTTTNGGGHSTCDSGRGCGTVFSITTSGQEKVLYSFAGGADGFAPIDRLTNIAGTLYGATPVGGFRKSCSTYYYPVGCGTIFKVTTSGTESVLYSFAGGNDGARPWGGLIKVGGTLYGTTNEGGANGFGTVFSLSL